MFIQITELVLGVMRLSWGHACVFSCSSVAPSCTPTHMNDPSSLICTLKYAGVRTIEKWLYRSMCLPVCVCARVLMTYFSLLLSLYFLGSKSTASSLPSHLCLRVYACLNHMVCLGAIYLQLKGHSCCVLTGEVLFSSLGLTNQVRRSKTAPLIALAERYERRWNYVAGYMVESYDNI